MKILITADIHFEKIPSEERESFFIFTKSTILKVKPDILIFAGDTVDSRNLRAESDDFKAIYNYVNDIAELCYDNRITFVVLKGTPSHDGDVMQNISMLIGSKVYYIDTLSTHLIKDVVIGFIPELYESRYDTFLDNVQSTFRQTQDIIIYHGMMDFAIPALRQIDSEYSLRKSLVMKYKDITLYSHTLVIGGHVHKYFHVGDCYYTGRAIAKPGEVTREQIFGMHEINIDLKTKSWTIKTHHNPYTKDVFSWVVDFSKENLEDLIARAERYPNDGYKLKALLDHSTECKDKWNQFCKIINPQYYQIKMIQAEKTMQAVRVESKDVDALLEEFYKSKTKKSISKHLINELGIHE